MALVFLWASDKEAQIDKKHGVDVAVVVAKRNINEFEQIRKEMLTVKLIPKKFVQPGSQKRPKDLEGTIANSPIKKGEQVLSTKVLLKGAKTGLASQVAISHRAFSVPVNDVTGVTRLLQPGDRVDIISAIPYQSETGQEAEVKTVLQNVHVLAVGEIIQNNIPQALQKDPVTGKSKAINLRGKRNYGTITIEINPEEAQMLIFVMEAGAQMFLTLRNPVDRTIVSVPTTTVDEVLGPNSKKIRREIAKKREEEAASAAARRIQSVPSLPRPPPPPPNPFLQGGGSVVPK